MKVVFMGTPDFAVSTLEAIYNAGHEIVLVVTQPDKPRGRSGKLVPSDVKAWAMEHDLEVFSPDRIKKPENVEYLKNFEADVFVVTAYGQMLSQEILDMPRLGCVNVHASLLPKYRGAAPIQWAVINGDEITGVTTQMMELSCDTGDILQTIEYRIAPDETGGSLFDKLAGLGGELAVSTIEALEKGEITRTPQNESEATHVSMFSKEFGHIDFTKSAIEIERLIRGLNPWPSAYTSIDGKTLKLWRAEVVEATAQPGEIVAVDKDSMTVACGSGALKVLELQLEGKKRMSCGDFLRGNSVEIGKKLGE